MAVEDRLTELSALGGGGDKVRGGLVVASNREPYSHCCAGGELQVEVPTGGLVSALDIVLRHTGGTWVAWGSGSADRQEADAAGRVSVPPEDPCYTLRRVWLSERTVSHYYHGFANRVLWPLFHGEPDRGFFRECFWDAYLLANQSFAAAIEEEGGDDATVWVHDYHLCLVPALIRAAQPARTIAHFWHIPWPAPEIFHNCPHAAELLEGLLGNDLIGFQIPEHAENFLACAESLPGVRVDHRALTVTRAGRSTQVKTFPISIDFRSFDTLAASPQTARLMKSFRQEFNLPELVGIGVDRLEFSKALMQRLHALDLLFRRYPSLRGRFSFIQVAVMTRRGEPYLGHRREVEELMARINRNYARDGWQPIIYRDRPLGRPELIALYRMADLAVVTPVCDGMNLVAKEYVASRGDGDGSLVLSRHAGASAELVQALLVDPCDTEGFAAAIRRALIMPRRERRARMESLRKTVREHTIYHWIGDILSELALVPFMREGRFKHAITHWPEIAGRLAGKELLLCLDFDGTLAPIVERPEFAEMPQEVHALLVLLQQRCQVAILSGRSLADVRARTGIAGLIYGGNHGAELELAGERVPGLPDDRPALAEFLARAEQELAGIDGVIIEDKGVSASVHFRLVHPSQLARFGAAFRDLSRAYRQRFSIREGRKVFEVRPRGAWGKGEALRWLLEAAQQGKTPIYLGDDISDEDAFRAVRGIGIAVSIGGSPEAEFCLGRQAEVREFLELLAAAPQGASRQQGDQCT